MGGPGDHDEPTSVHVRRAVDGDAQSVAWVVERFDPFVEAQVRFRLAALGLGSEALRDVANEVWLIALQRMGELRPREGRFAPVLARFLSSTALNKCNTHLKRQIRRRREQRPAAGAGNREGGAALSELARDSLGVVTRAAAGDLRQQIAVALERLGPEKREVLVLRLFEHCTNAEISAELGVPANTVAVRYRRALRELARCLPASLARELRGMHAAPESSPPA